MRLSSFRSPTNKSDGRLCPDFVFILVAASNAELDENNDSFGLAAVVGSCFPEFVGSCFG